MSPSFSPAKRTNDTNVLVVGAGPVGLTLAIDLAWRGIDVTLLERRAAGEPPSVKCNHISARSMEIFRRLGVAEPLRHAGLPADYPHDAVYRTTATGIELARILIPSRLGRTTGAPGPDTSWPTPEPPHRINQIYFEPILFAHAASQAGIKILNRTQAEGFIQDEAGVVASLRNLKTGESSTLRCEYLVGCDGARSLVRRAVGAQFVGTAMIQRVQSTCIRAPGLRPLLHGTPAWMYLSLNPRRCGTTIAIDGHEIWLIHNHLREDESDFDAVDRDWAIRTILGVGPDFSYEVLSKEDWIGRRLVADHFRDRRVFICGDAAHIWAPYAGYGMNAGIADAATLSWLIAAVERGWAAPEILSAYEAERRPIIDQVSRFTMDLALKVMKQRRQTPLEIESPGIEGDAVRGRVGQEAYELNVQQYCCGGLNFGYFYDCSPIIAYDGAPHPPYTMADFTPSCVPGCRAPHLWLQDHRSLYDALGSGFTLLRLDPQVTVSGLLTAAATRGVPLDLLDVADGPARTLYDSALVLVRPDQHVAWRGESEPTNPWRLIDRIRGAADEHRV